MQYRAAGSTSVSGLPVRGEEWVPLAHARHKTRLAVHHTGAITMDIVGRLAVATLIAILVMNVTSALFRGYGWTAAIGWESTWFITCIICASLLPNGVRHQFTWASTWKGIILDWPEMVIIFLWLKDVVEYGAPYGVVGPFFFALSVGAAEEMLFRVLILGWLVTRLKAPSAVLVSAVVFGLVHLNELSLVGVMNVVPQFSGGMVLGAMYLRTRNFLGGVIMHTLWDFPIFMSYGLVSGGSVELGMPSPASTAFWMLFAVYGLWLVRHGADVEGNEYRTHPCYQRGL